MVINVNNCIDRNIKYDPRLNLKRSAAVDVINLRVASRHRNVAQSLDIGSHVQCDH